jgi:hypothetical protein
MRPWSASSDLGLKKVLGAGADGLDRRGQQFVHLQLALGVQHAVAAPLERAREGASKGLVILHPGLWYNWGDWAEYNKTIAGGGSRNRHLLSELRRRCRGIWLRPLGELGIAEQNREALAFALLAWWQWRGHPGSHPSITAASRPAVLGVRTDPNQPSRRWPDI